MSKISTPRRTIADIIGRIGGIAFQIKYLALSAVGGAARAVDQGRGFAVVAGEVRRPAHRSADAACEFKMLIADAVDRLQRGAARGQSGLRYA